MFFSSWWKKATGAVAKTSELSSSGMEIEIAELLYVLILFHLVIHCILLVDDSKFANLAHQSVEFILVGVFLCPILDCRGPVVVACSFGSCLVAVCVAWQ
ncbi:hypothetical protein P8452_43781 [Trifolium repens]|nr:hypothetical protein P8452_43781 [Trifolium repens]